MPSMTAAEKQQFTLQVCNIVRSIPRKQVTSCGHIAKLVGRPKSARQVKLAVEMMSHTSSKLPWYRVVSTSGIVSAHGSCRQQRMLESEGIEVQIGSYGESRINFASFGWFPSPATFHADSDIESDMEDWAS